VENLTENGLFFGVVEKLLTGDVRTWAKKYGWFSSSVRLWADPVKVYGLCILVSYWTAVP